MTREQQLLELKYSVREVMKTRPGRRLMHHLLENVCRTFASTVTGEIGTYAEGRRGAGLSLQALLQDWAPAEFVLLLGEELQAREETKREGS